MSGRDEPTNSPQLIAEYRYDGLGRRIWRRVTNSGDFDRIETYYYKDWQMLEARTVTLDLQGEPEADAPVRQFVWGSRYIDEIVCMDVDTDSDGDCLDAGGSARQHYLQDANWNVLAVREGTDVIERYEYDPYGTCRIYAGWNAAEGREDLTVIGASRIDNPIRYAGYHFDAETELYHVRHRMYSPSLQRWLQRDPMGYLDGVDLYQYVRSLPPTLVDPWGLEGLKPIIERNRELEEQYYNTKPKEPCTGICGEDQYKGLRDKVHKWCARKTGEPDRCKGNDDCQSIYSKYWSKKRCRESQKDLNDTCFPADTYPGSPHREHRQIVDEYGKGMATCKALWE